MMDDTSRDETKESSGRGETGREKGLASRRLALEILIRVEKGKAFSNVLLSSSLKKSKLSKRDRAFVTCLVQGVMRNKRLIDHRIERVSSKPLAKLPVVLHNTLRLGVFQLDFLEDVPPSAVISTSTSLARRCGHDGLARYTTAVLRAHLRSRDDQEGKDDNTDTSSDGDDYASLATRFSMPDWIVERWMGTYGPEETLTLLKQAQSEPVFALRVNETAVTRQGLQDILERAGVQVEQSKLVPSCLLLQSRGKLRGGFEQFPGYEEGLFSVQDETAALVSLIVDPKAGETVVDLCAAPGGKTLHMSELMDNTGKVIAVDKYGSRLRLLRENRRRLSLSNVEIVEADGTAFSLEQPAERVLVDAPCSGTGVMNRRPDLRYRTSLEDIEKLQSLQLSLLENAAALLKPGGVLVYSTCSVEPEENQLVVEKLLAGSAGQGLRLDDLKPFLASSRALSDAATHGMLQILPSMHGLSGFFVARLVKT